MKLQAFCGIRCPAETAVMFLKQLQATGYTFAQAKAAEAWQFRGSCFQYAGTQPRLELSHFYPTRKQLETIEDLTVLSLDELQQVKGQAYQRGRAAEYQAMLTAQRSEVQALPESVGETLQRERQLLEFKQEVERLQIELNDARKMYDDLISQIVFEEPEQSQTNGETQ